MFDWLNRYAAAVQALASVCSVIATVGLLPRAAAQFLTEISRVFNGEILASAV